jgi:hypothetical protein
VEAALVQTLSLAEVGHASQLVGVVRNEGDEGGVMLLLTVDLDIEVEQRAAAAESFGQHAGECGGAVPRPLGRVVDEARVEAERDVVHEPALTDPADVYPALDSVECGQGADRVVGVETEVEPEVVPRPERDADERFPAFDSDSRDGSNGAVAARDADRCASGRSFPGELAGVVTLGEDVRLDAALAGRRDQFVRRRALVPGARVDEE